MLKVSEPLEYFAQLGLLSEKATQFPWDKLSIEDCSRLSVELRRLLQRTDFLHFESGLVETFFRKLLAEYMPPNNAFYIHNGHSLEWVIEREMWGVWSVLRTALLPMSPTPVQDAALVACHASRKAASALCEKTGSAHGHTPLPEVALLAPPEKIASQHPVKKPLPPYLRVV